MTTADHPEAVDVRVPVLTFNRGTYLGSTSIGLDYMQEVLQMPRMKGTDKVGREWGRVLLH